MSPSTVELIAAVTEHICKPLRLKVFVENSQMLNWQWIPSCVGELVMPVLNGMPNSSLLTPDIHSESLFHLSFHSPKENYSSETLGDSQGEGVDNAGSLPTPHLHPQGAIRLGGCDVGLGGLSSPHLFITLPSPSFSLHLSLLNAVQPFYICSICLKEWLASAPSSASSTGRIKPGKCWHWDEIRVFYMHSLVYIVCVCE